MLPFTENKERHVLFAIHLLSGTKEDQYDVEIDRRGNFMYLYYDPSKITDDPNMLLDHLVYDGGDGEGVEVFFVDAHNIRENASIITDEISGRQMVQRIKTPFKVEARFVDIKPKTCPKILPGVTYFDCAHEDYWDEDVVPRADRQQFMRTVGNYHVMTLVLREDNETKKKPKWFSAGTISPRKKSSTNSDGDSPDKPWLGKSPSNKKRKDTRFFSGRK